MDDFFVQELSGLSRSQMAQRLQQAIDRSEFEVYLQPKVDLRHNQIAGAEALIRWHLPGEGIVNPDRFVPILEEQGLACKIDLFVFERVCELLHRWQEEKRPLLPISVNFSRSQIKNDRPLRRYVALQKKYAVPTRLLELELLETGREENLEGVTRLFREVREAGLDFALDDFGSGYSSLNVLQTISANTLKLDRHFLNENEEHRLRGYYIIESVLSLARNLRMRVVVEGVETQEQADFLRGINCDLVQGFYFYRPMPVAEFEKLVAGGDVLGASCPAGA